MDNSNQNTGFTSNIGAILAAVGSAVGLGNIWRFPYICGKYGGGAFLMVYLLFIFLLGMSMMMAEFTMGRRAGHTPSKSFPILAPQRPQWRYVGHFGILATFLTIAIYFVISGWTLSYFVDTLTGRLSQLGTDTAAVSGYFKEFSESVWHPVIFLVAFAAITAIVIMGGVQKGIEKVSKILMPLLLFILIALCVYALTLPGSSTGLRYLLVPDFSKLNAEAILAALGQALFSLSVGIGMMMVYGSYLPKSDSILRTSLWITVSDTVIALLSGVVVFSVVFSCGMQPAEGAGLVFKVLPLVFNQMGAIGTVIGSMFFLLLVLAALTSAISLLEYLCVWLSEVLRCSRRVSSALCTAVSVAVAIVLSLSNGTLSGLKVAGRTFFDLFDLMSGTYFFPLCALGIALFFGWVMSADDAKDELSNHGKLSIRWFPSFRFLMRYVLPASLITILIAGMLKN